MARGEKIIKICPVCSKTFEVLKSNDKKYCSKECAMFARRTGHDIACDNCGKLFYRRQYHIDRQSKKKQNNFCCKECAIEYKHNHTHELRECEICGKKFEVSKLSTQKLCSIECQKEWQKTQVKELNPNFKSELIPCTYCGTLHYVKPYKLEEQSHFFCCKECQRKWYAEIHSQTDEVKNRSREVMLQLLQSGKMNVDSAPQLEINRVLDSLNEKYERERPFDYYTVDNYLVHHNLIIEVNGDYWHTNPQKFNSHISQTQYDRIGRDKAKHTYIKNQYGIEILYLWEYDITNNIDVCEKLIQQYIVNNGILINYHSFNYSIINGKLVLNENIIVPYQDMESHQYKQILTIA